MLVWDHSFDVMISVDARSTTILSPVLVIVAKIGMHQYASPCPWWYRIPKSAGACYSILARDSSVLWTSLGADFILHQAVLLLSFKVGMFVHRL